MKSSARSIEVDRIVSQIDETRVSEHFRNPDRPDSRFVKPRRRQDPSIRRAKTRLRTAAYRNRLDQRRAASTSQIAMSLLVALVTSKQSSIMAGDRDLIGRALIDLQSRGFNLTEVLDTLQRLRRRVVDQPEDAASDSPVIPTI